MVTRVHAACVLPMNAPPIAGGWLDVAGGTIVAMGKGRPTSAGDDGQAPHVLDLGHAVVLPGLVNAHTHLELSHLRGRVAPAASFVEWVQALLALRALRLGCRLMVFTHDTGGWIALGRRATGRTDRVAVLAPGSAVNRVSSADAPVLRMLLPDPATGTPPSPDPDLPGWSTELSASPRLTPALADRLAAADLVLAHRLPPTEAAGLCAARRLAGPVAHLLQVLHDDMLAVLSPAGQRYAWIGPTRLEADILAEPPAGTPSR